MSKLGPEARAILEAGRAGDEPTAADRARLRARVMSAVAAGALGPTSQVATTAGAATAKGALPLGWKVLGGLAVLGLVGTGLLVSRSFYEGRREPGNPAPEAAPAAVETPPEPASSPSGEAAPPDRDDGPTSKPASPPPKGTTVEPPSPPGPPASRSSAPPPVAEGRRPRPAPEAAAPGADDDTLVAETRRLREAHGALQGGDPAKALTMLDAQSAAFQNGQLREERGAARVLALCRLGRMEEGKAAATRFLAEYPRSPLSDRVRAACAPGKGP